MRARAGKYSKILLPSTGDKKQKGLSRYLKALFLLGLFNPDFFASASVPP